MATYVMGDFHGAYKAVLQCFERSGFDAENDMLIQLGDITDGAPEVYECVDELLKIRHLIAIKGNHDDWFDEFIKTDFHPYFWQYGGIGTLISYLGHAGKNGQYRASSMGYKSSLEARDIPKAHQDFFDKQRLYYIDDDNRLFVHAGFKRNIPFSRQDPSDFYWDRTLWQHALGYYSPVPNIPEQDDPVNNEPFKEIFIGHTPTTNLDADIPLRALNIFNLDTGAGHSGKLTIMNVETKEFWQSDSIAQLYQVNQTKNQRHANKRQLGRNRRGPNQRRL